MKKEIIIAITMAMASFFIVNTIKAQSSLVYNHAMLIDNNLQTVPSGKVWKVVSVFGSAPRLCLAHPKGTISSRPYSWFNAQGFIVNSVTVYSETSYAGTYSSSSGHYWYSDNACSLNGTWDSKLNWGTYDINPNPNILPMWLPTGTTLQALSGTYVSVIEFDII